MWRWLPKLLLWLLISPLLLAADIRLRGGKVLTDATIVSEDGNRLFIRHAGGATWVRRDELARESRPKENGTTVLQLPAFGEPKATGTGTVIADRHVLTAGHVVAKAGRILVVTETGTFEASVAFLDKAHDLALLKLPEGEFQAIPVSESARLGQTVATIGFPHIAVQGFSPKVTKGEISSLNGVNDDPRAWQISVPVQSGNSGGPLLDEYGNLVGVITAKLNTNAPVLRGDVPQNVNYAVKGAHVLQMLKSRVALTIPASFKKVAFEDMVARVQHSIVLVLVY